MTTINFRKPCEKSFEAVQESLLLAYSHSCWGVEQMLQLKSVMKKIIDTE